VPPNLWLTVTVGSSVHLEASRTVVVIAGAIVVLVLLLLALRAAMPALAAGLLAATPIPAAEPATSEYSGQGTSHGFTPPAGRSGD
jgi:hypothetical protein